ncbi:hypothetical protein C8R43DRAFT_1089333 [Mycena crocata]|nr:hypothetical protein C8R43DRAFT_1089333 [Mycena crocata]
MPRHRADIVDFAVGDDDENPSADLGVYISTDGQRRQEEMMNISHKKRRLTDLLAEWNPVPEDGYSEMEDRDSTSNPLNAVPSEPVSRKRKEYASSDDPASLWRPKKSFFLDELIRHDGLGDDMHSPHCAHCQKPYEQPDRRMVSEGRTKPTAMRIFKCGDCGQFLQCHSCCLSHHTLTPLHVIKEWSGEFWIDTTLAQIGLVYQLGHGGFPCVAPVVHQLHIRYCGCSKSDHADHLEQLLRNAWYPASVTDPATCATFKTLDAFRLYNVVGNMNVHDFIHAMERGTDAKASTGMTWLPDRYKQFQRMARQWAFLLRVKRAGRGHDAEGLDNTKLRDCAIICWACPYEGRNLPLDWRDVDPKLRFLYMLLLAVDANFKLKNRKRANEIDDPSLGPGWGYWVEPRRYRRHIRKYVAEKDMSTCIAFAALLQKDTRLTTGLRASGVGGCVCTRHECVRPNGVGDLQKGERYANMDFIVMSALVGFNLLLLTISYDIACQWKKNLEDRCAKLPRKLRLPFSQFTYQCALPVWHAASHDEKCQVENSLSYKPGVGKSDGEGVERVWSVLNPAAYHTKDSGRGQRVDVLEDKIDSLNHGKNFGQGDSLQRKLIVAIAERDRQLAAFESVSQTVERDLKKEWVNMVDRWEADSSQPNPYVLLRQDCPSEAEVRLELKQAEDEALNGARIPLAGSSATAFLVAGLQIEESQRRIIADLGETALITADRESKLYDWRRTLLVKVSQFRDLQRIYMPGAAVVIANAEAERDADAVPPKAERITLYMPSEMPAASGDPLRGCVEGLLAMEAKLRVAQCTNALCALRSRLHAKRHLITFRNANVTGQIQSTKARTLIGQVGERVEACAAKYRRAREAVISLKGEEEGERFWELRAADIQLDGDAEESDSAARKKLAMIGAGRGERAPRDAPGTSKRIMSWMWTAPGALDDEDEQLHDSIRVEWVRARARKIRWTEEVQLLREEMRRVLRYLEWQAGWWEERLEPRAGLTLEVAAGVRAYALKQAHLHDRLGAFFKLRWQMSAVQAARLILALDLAAGSEPLGLDALFSPGEPIETSTE